MNVVDIASVSSASQWEDSNYMSGLDSRDVEMRRCRTAGRVDDRASDSLPTRPKGNGSLSGRARERKLLVGKGER